MRGAADCRWLRVVLALLLLAATFLLMSPPSDEGYPGARPWGTWSYSPLHQIINWMKLGGSVATIRGVEIKQLAFHIATVLILLVLGIRAAISARFPAERRTAKGAWFVAQGFSRPVGADVAGERDLGR